MWLPSLPLPDRNDPAQVRLNNELRRIRPAVVGWRAFPAQPWYGSPNGCIEFRVQTSPAVYPSHFYSETTGDVPAGLDLMAEMLFDVTDARARYARILTDPDGIDLPNDAPWRGGW